MSGFLCKEVLSYLETRNPMEIDKKACMSSIGVVESLSAKLRRGAAW